MLAAAAAVTAVLAAPASASRQGCINRAKSTPVIVDSSNKAIVLEISGKLYGCSYDRERLNELPDQGRGSHIEAKRLRVTGRYAAYPLKTGGDRYIYSVGLRAGHTLGSSRGSGVGTDIRLDKLVMRANGSIAWAITYPASDPTDERAWTAVWRIDHTGRERLDIDTDSVHGRQHRIVPSSLRLGHFGDDWFVSWQRSQEAPKRAPIN